MNGFKVSVIPLPAGYFDKLALEEMRLPSAASFHSHVASWKLRREDIPQFLGNAFDSRDDDQVKDGLAHANHASSPRGHRLSLVANTVSKRHQQFGAKRPFSGEIVVKNFLRKTQRMLDLAFFQAGEKSDKRSQVTLVRPFQTPYILVADIPIDDNRETVIGDQNKGGDRSSDPAIPVLKWVDLGEAMVKPGSLDDGRLATLG